MSEIDAKDIETSEMVSPKLAYMGYLLQSVHKYDLEVRGLDLPAVARRAYDTRKTRSAVAAPDITLRLMHIAWQTETAAQVAVNSSNDSTRQLLIHAMPMHAYYAVFNMACAESSFSAPSRTRGDAHTSIQRAFAKSEVKHSSGAWGETFSGDFSRPAKADFRPPICEPRTGPLDVLNATPAEGLCDALRTTRKWQFLKARDEKMRSREQDQYFIQRGTEADSRSPRLRNGMVAKLQQEMRPTSLMDFLYELRIGVNYKDVSEFRNLEDRGLVRDYYLGLDHLINFGMLPFEVGVAMRIGRKAYRKHFEAWHSRVRNTAPWAGDVASKRTKAIYDTLA